METKCRYNSSASLLLFNSNIVAMVMVMADVKKELNIPKINTIRRWYNTTELTIVLAVYLHVLRYWCRTLASVMPLVRLDYSLSLLYKSTLSTWAYPWTFLRQQELFKEDVHTLSIFPCYDIRQQLFSLWKSYKSWCSCSSFLISSQ